MGTNQQPKKPAVWQDIRPIKNAKTIDKIPDKKSKFSFATKINLRNRFKKTSQKITNKKIVLLLKKLYTKNKIISTISVALVIVLAGFSVKTIIFDNSKSPEQIKIEEMAAKTPQFKTFLPQGKTIDELGGWHKLTPPNSSVVFVYLDKINNVRVRVTQQTMPENFINDKNAQIEQLAKNFKADEKITVGETIAYIGTNINGVQSVIFEKNNTLILITSAAKINSTSWAEYIGSLN